MNPIEDSVNQHKAISYYHSNPKISEEARIQLNENPNSEDPVLLGEQVIEKKPTNVEISKIGFIDDDKFAKCMIDLSHYPDLLDMPIENFQIEFLSERRFSVTCLSQKTNKLYKLLVMKTREDYNVEKSKFYLKKNRIFVCLKKLEDNKEWWGLKGM